MRAIGSRGLGFCGYMRETRIHLSSTTQLSKGGDKIESHELKLETALRPRIVMTFVALLRSNSLSYSRQMGTLIGALSLIV